MMCVCGECWPPPAVLISLSLCVLWCLLSKAVAVIKARTSGHKTVSRKTASPELGEVIEDGSAHKIAAAALTSIWLGKTIKNCIVVSIVCESND